MKKTYIAPTMDVIKVQVANVMATSSMPISNETIVDSDIMLGRENNASGSDAWNEW